MHLQAELDDINWLLLWELQESAWQSMTELANKVGLTPQAVRQRIQRMQSAGIITGFHAMVNTAMIGLPVTAFIRVTLPGERSARFAALVKEQPEVLECHKVTGVESFLLKVVVSSLSHLDLLISHLEKHGDCITSVVLSSPVVRRSISRDILRGERCLNKHNS